MLDFSQFSLKTGWDSVYDFGKRIAGLAAFMCVAAALVPIWLPSQTALQYQLNDNTRRLAILENVPADIAVIKQEQTRQAQEIRETRESVEGIRIAAFTGTAGLLCFLASWIFNLFGARVSASRNRRIES